MKCTPLPFRSNRRPGGLSKVCLVRAQKSSLRNPKLQVLVPKLQVQDKTRSHMHTYVLKTSLTREFSATYVYHQHLQDIGFKNTIRKPKRSEHMKEEQRHNHLQPRSQKPTDRPPNHEPLGRERPAAIELLLQ